MPVAFSKDREVLPMAVCLEVVHSGASLDEPVAQSCNGTLKLVVCIVVVHSGDL